jgi:3-phenylpropionate/trans-cinnamate dioxygenase ferredoxin reductase component
MTGTSGSGTLIVGASQAGVQVASTLRELGYAEPITIVGAELHPPYQRPPLSKALLQGELTTDALLFRSPQFYAEQRIELALGERISSVERSPDGSGIAFSESGRQFPFDQLALTVGARARRLPIPGEELAGVRYLRDAEHALALRDELTGAQDVVIVGGGFIGLEVAASARKLGKDVTVVLADDRLMSRAVGEPVSDFFREAHTRRGVALHFSVALTRFVDDGTGRVGAVELADGRQLKADLVVIGIGAAPRTELAERLGLAVQNGILVDEHGVASDGTTVAAGDCVSCPSPVTGPFERLRFESVNTAVEQAKVAAATLAGTPVAYRTPPWFWSDQFDLKLQVAGLSQGYDHFVLRGDPGVEKFSVLYYRDGRLAAVECVNSPLDFMAVRSALSSGRSVPAELAADVSVPLKKLLRSDVPLPPAAAAP